MPLRDIAGGRVRMGFVYGWSWMGQAYYETVRVDTKSPVHDHAHCSCICH